MLETDGIAALTTRRIAEAAETSPPALYELFGDKAGLARALFYEGFERLAAVLDEIPMTDDPRADLVAAALAFRAFALEHRRLFEVMYAQPFEHFAPTTEERRHGAGSQSFLLRVVTRALSHRDSEQRCVDVVDAAHVLMALVIGLASQEAAGLLGSQEDARQRRWRLGVEAALDGLLTI